MKDSDNNTNNNKLIVPIRYYYYDSSFAFSLITLTCLSTIWSGYFFGKLAFMFWKKLT